MHEGVTKARTVTIALPAGHSRRVRREEHAPLVESGHTTTRTCHVEGHAVIVTEGPGFLDFQLVPEGGEEPSNMQVHRVIPGLSVVFYAFNSPRCHVFNDSQIVRTVAQESPRSRPMLEINICRGGTFRTLDGDRRSIVVLQQGDISLAVTSLKDGTRAPKGASECDWVLEIPTSRYRGIGLIVDIEAVERSAGALLEDLDIDLRGLAAAYRLDERIFVMPSGDGIDRIADKLEYDHDVGRATLMKVGALELLACIQVRSVPEGSLERPKFSVEAIRLVRDARNFAVRGYRTRYSISDLARRFSMSATAFKTTFREVYGESYACYMRRVRLKRARAMLAEGARVTEVATDVGYENPSKFTSAFRKEFGESPSAYRERMTESSGSTRGAHA